MFKEKILNIVTNKYGLNQKDSVGPVSHWVRKCSPKTIKDWEDYYYAKLAGMLKLKDIKMIPQKYLEGLGRILYKKITENKDLESEGINDGDCIQYIRNLVIKRTFDGYQTEMEIIYGQLQNILKIPIKPTSDKWDRLYNVDFYIKVKGKCIGLQIKPTTFKNAPGAEKWKEMLAKTHKKFELDFGGKVFTIFSQTQNNKKIIYNQHIINDIQKEIERLKRT